MNSETIQMDESANIRMLKDELTRLRAIERTALADRLKQRDISNEEVEKHPDIQALHRRIEEERGIERARLESAERQRARVEAEEAYRGQFE